MNIFELKKYFRSSEVCPEAVDDEEWVDGDVAGPEYQEMTDCGHGGWVGTKHNFTKK